MAGSTNNIKDPPHFIFIWTIGNACEPCFIDSPAFTVKDIEMTMWHLTLEIDCGKFVSLHMKRLPTNNGADCVYLKFDMSFLGIDGLPIIERADCYKVAKGGTFGFNQFADKYDLLFRRRAKFMPKDSLTIRCRMWKAETKIAHPDTCFARTLLRQERYFFVWAVRKFSAFQKHSLRELVLNTTAFDQITFQLFMTEKHGKEYVGLRANYSVPDQDQSCIMNLSLLDFEGKTVHSKERFGHLCEEFKFKKFFEKRRLVEDRVSLLPNDVMSLRCEIQAEAKIVWSTIENYRYLHQVSSEIIDASREEVVLVEQVGDVPSSFKRPMQDLLKEGFLSDVILQTKTKSFPAHKCILSARSRVFKAMFTRDMKEKTSTTVEIPDVDEDTMRELLLYIYTNEFRRANCPGAIDLLRAADKYEILNLKGICSAFLKCELSADSVCDVLSVADMHHDRELREAAEEFLMHQEDGFFTSDTWESFKEENSKLAFEVLERMLCNTKKKLIAAVCGRDPRGSR